MTSAAGSRTYGAAATTKLQPQPLQLLVGVALVPAQPLLLLLPQSTKLARARQRPLRSPLLPQLPATVLALLL
jgi:hypothetical protein